MACLMSILFLFLVSPSFSFPPRRGGYVYAVSTGVNGYQNLAPDQRYWCFEVVKDLFWGTKPEDLKEKGVEFYSHNLRVSYEYISRKTLLFGCNEMAKINTNS